MADPTLVQGLVTIGFASLAGGVTNAVAVWMLFHPHERRGVGPLAIQGAIPKNRARLAKTIGRTVGERLLTPEDLGRHLRQPHLRDAFDGTLDAFFRAALETERGSLREALPAALVPEIEALGDRTGPMLAERVAAWAASDGFADRVAAWLERARASYGERAVSDVLTVARREALRDRVEDWVAQAVAHPVLEDTVREWLARQVTRFAEDRAPLMERLPPGLVAALERAISGYLPVALERLAGMLRDPDARERIEHALHELFARFLKDLMLHERIVARLVVTEKTITRALDNLGGGGVGELARLLDEPAMRTHVARNINDAVVSFLRKPLADHVEALGPERMAGITDAAASQILAVLRDPRTRRAAADRLDQALAGNDDRTWGDLLDHLPPERAAAWLSGALQSDQARQLIAEAWSSAFRSILDRPIGRPADLLGDDAASRLTERLAPALWDWTQEQVPIVVTRIDIPAMVEQKVLSFSLDRMEQIVRMTTQRELNVIVRLGYLLGAIVGAAAWGISVVVG